MNEDELLQQAFQELDNELPDATAEGTPGNASDPQAFPDIRQSMAVAKEKNTGKLSRFVRSVGDGALKAAFETKDFVMGEPKEWEKSDFRRHVERQDKALDSLGVGYSLTSGVSQIATGLIGAGKLTAPLKLAQYGKGAVVGGEIAKGALAGAIVVDPHEERLSNLIESYPSLQNPVSDYLKSDPSDSAAEGRFKNAIESLGVDAAFLGAVKAIKLLKAGDQAGAVREIKRMERAQQANKDAFGMDFSEQAPKGNLEADAAKLANQNEFGLDFSETPPAKPGVDPAATPEAVAAKQANKDAFGLPKEQPQAAPTAAVEPSAVPEAQLQQIAPGDAPRAAPKVKSAQVADEEVATIMAASKKDADAIAQHGSKEAALAAGYKFAQAPPLPWQKLRGTDEVMAFVGQSAKVLQSRFEKAKGGAVMGDKRVEALAADLGRTFNMEPDLVVGEIKQAGAKAAKMVPFMEAGLRIGNKMFQDTADLAEAIRNGNLEAFGGDIAAAHAELKTRLAASIDVLAAANSVLANSGRALRRARSDFKIRPQDLDALKTLDGDKLVDMVRQTGGDASKALLMANPAWSKRMIEGANFLMTNGLLWGYPTHLVNLSTNAYMLAARPTEKLIGALSQSIITKDAGRKAELTFMAKQAIREYTYTIASIGDGWSAAVEAFRRGDSILAPHNVEFFDPSLGGAQGLPWKPVKGTGDLLHNLYVSLNAKTLIGLPTRTLGSADEFFKTMRYRAVVQSRAAVSAAEQGLSPEATRAFIQQEMDRSIDPLTGQAVDPAVLREAQMTSFQQNLDYKTTADTNLGLAITNARRTSPILGLILPFVKTPINVIRYGIKMSPGLNLLQREFRDDIMGTNGMEAQASAIGQMTLGSMFAALAANLAQSGALIGAGPEDKKVKSDWAASGAKPYSFVWKDAEGKTSYFPIGRFDPVGMAFGLVADVTETIRKDPEGDHSAIIGAAVLSIAKNLGEKSFLLNINSAIEAFQEPEKFGARYFGQMAGNMIPGSSLMRTHNPDPYLRDARTFVDGVIRGVPVLSRRVPVRYTPFGDPVERQIGLTSTQGRDLVENEHSRIVLQTGKGVSRPGTTLDNGVDLRDIKLKDGITAYERLQQLMGHPPGAPPLKASLEKLIKSDAYQDLVDGDGDLKGTRLNAIVSLREKYVAAARKALLRENPELVPMMKARQMEAAGAYLQNKHKGAAEVPGARALLDALRPQ